MKKNFILICLLLFSINLYSYEYVDWDNMYANDWWIEDGNTLVISGKGEMDPDLYYNYRDKADRITKIIIKEGVTSTCNFAFENLVSVTEVSLPNSLKEIKSHTFSNCISLKSITIPNSVTLMGNYIFYDCISLESVILPKNLKIIPEGLFSGCISLSVCEIPEGVLKIDSFAFSQCESLAGKIKVPNSVKKISPYENEILR